MSDPSGCSNKREYESRSLLSLGFWNPSVLRAKALGRVRAEGLCQWSGDGAVVISVLTDGHG